MKNCCNQNCNQGRDCPEEGPIFEIDYPVWILVAIILVWGILGMIGLASIVGWMR